MIQTIQIVTLLQGLFLILYLFFNRKKYHFYNYAFFSASIISLIFYIVGDDNNNLFLNKYDFFFVDKTLFVTLLFLFLKYYNSSVKIKPGIILYFVPCLMYISVELYEANVKESSIIEIIEFIITAAFIVYLIASLRLLKKLEIDRVIKWPFYFLLYSLLITFIVDLGEFLIEEQSFMKLSTILIFEVSVLFYYLTFVFALNHNFLDLPLQNPKYKNSALNNNDVEDYKKRIIAAMENDKVFKNENLSLQTFSESVNIPKHYISEILNVHLKTNFQDFVNEYRVEEFIKLYTNPENSHFSILGLATSVGFKNKATFNSNFKKIKGLSPTEYKRHN
ncbi:MAG: helix-turn-helix domain-containing protein [Flavobacterium sp.]